MLGTSPANIGRKRLLLAFHESGCRFIHFYSTSMRPKVMARCSAKVPLGGCERFRLFRNRRAGHRGKPTKGHRKWPLPGEQKPFPALVLRDAIIFSCYDSHGCCEKTSLCARSLSLAFPLYLHAFKAFFAAKRAIYKVQPSMHIPLNMTSSLQFIAGGRKVAGALHRRTNFFR